MEKEQTRSIEKTNTERKKPNKILYLYNSIYNYLIFWRLKKKARKRAMGLKQFVGVMPIDGKLKIVHLSGLDNLNKYRMKHKMGKISFKEFKKSCYVGFYADGRMAL